MEDGERYRDYVTKLVTKRAELEVQIDAFFKATRNQEPDKLGFYVKRNEGFLEFEQEYGFKVIADLELSPLYASRAYSEYVSQFTRLYKFYSNLIGFKPTAET